MPFFCYILQCSDGTYYTGWTTDPLRREKQHNAGTGARYTGMRRPVKIAYIEEQPDRRTAMLREIQIKKLGRAGKRKLVDSQREKSTTQEVTPQEDIHQPGGQGGQQ